LAINPAGIDQPATTSTPLAAASPAASALWKSGIKHIAAFIVDLRPDVEQ